MTEPRTGLPEWKTVPKQALTDTIRNISGIPRPTALTRQDKGDLVAMVEAVWDEWDDDMRAYFLEKLNVEIEFQRAKAS